MITRDEITKRIDELRKQKEQTVEQAKAQINALDGAIQDAEFWLKEFDKPEEVKSDGPPVPTEE